MFLVQESNLNLTDDGIDGPFVAGAHTCFICRFVIDSHYSHYIENSNIYTEEGFNDVYFNNIDTVCIIIHTLFESIVSGINDDLYKAKYFYVKSQVTVLS